MLFRKKFRIRVKGNQANLDKFSDAAKKALRKISNITNNIWRTKSPLSIEAVPEAKNHKGILPSSFIKKDQILSNIKLLGMIHQMILKVNRGICICGI